MSNKNNLSNYKTQEELTSKFGVLVSSMEAFNDELQEYIIKCTTISQRLKMKKMVEHWKQICVDATGLVEKLEEIKEKKGNVDPVEVKLPFSSDTFAEAWREWKQYLIEQHGIMLSTRAEKRQLYFLDKYAGEKEDKAVQIMYMSESKLYTSLYNYTDKEISGKSKKVKIEDGEY